MAASRSDSFILSTDTGFQNRVKEALLAAAINITAEGISAANPFHLYVARHKLCSQILNNPGGYAALFAPAVATDATVLSDATQAGTVVLSAANVAAQSPKVADASIDSAVAGQFNGFIQS